MVFSTEETTTSTTLLEHASSALHQYLSEASTTSRNDRLSTKYANMALVQTSRLLQNATNDASTDDDSNQDPQWKRTFGIVMSNILLFALIFGLSATVDSRNLKKQLTNKFAIGCGVTMQYLFMPILGCISVSVFSQFGLSKAMAIALLVVTASPGGSYSNWWCSTFNADLALSVAMTTVSSLLSVIFLPFNLFFYSWLAFGVFKVNDTVDASSIVKSIQFSALFQSLAVVLSAIVLGLLAGYKYDTAKFHGFAHKLGSFAGIFLIIFSIVVVSGPKAELGALGWSFYVATMLPCLGGLFLANICSRMVKLSPPEVMAIAIECCYQNTGIATSVAITMFHDKKERAQAVAVPLFYGIVSAGSILIFSIVSWKMGWTKAPANENIWKVITNSYEIDDVVDESNANQLVLQDDEEAAVNREAGADKDDIFNTPSSKKLDGRNRMNTFDSATATTVSSATDKSTPLRKSSDESYQELDNNSPAVVEEGDVTNGDNDYVVAKPKEIFRDE